LRKAAAHRSANPRDTESSEGFSNVDRLALGPSRRVMAVLETPLVLSLILMALSYREDTLNIHIERNP
jgi:hypothetical protein